MNHPPFPRVSRRSALAGLAALPVALRSSFATPVVGAESNNFIIRERVPENLESDFSALDSFITPNDKFFVRSHFAVPQLNPKTWRLKVEGAIKQPIELTYEDLLGMPAETKPVTLECAAMVASCFRPKSTAFNGNSARSAMPNGRAYP